VSVFYRFYHALLHSSLQERKVMMMEKHKLLWLFILILGILAGSVACGGLLGREEEAGGLEGTGNDGGDDTAAPPTVAQDNDNTGEPVTPEIVSDNNDNESEDGEGNGLVLEYHREGGIAGFCDIVQIDLNGEATISSCSTDPPRRIGSTRLTDEQLAMVQNWVETLDSFDSVQADPPVPDALSVGVVFHGEGEGEATEADIQAMQELAVALLAQPITE
jgi:hypothetical protein